MNDDSAPDGLARVQTESHIPATTWRQWCQRLEVDPAVAVELWDEICHPLMLSGQAPDVALILQLRAARPDIYIEDFREELPAVLLATSLADGLYTEGQGVRGALLRLYRHLGEGTGDSIARAFVAHTGSLALLDGILPDDLTLPKPVKFLCSGKGTLEDLCRFGRRTLKDDPRRDAVETAFDAALTLLPEPRPDPVPEPAEEVTGDAALEEDGNDPNDRDDDDDLAKALRAALAAVYADETIADPQERSARLRSIQDFNSLGVRIPSMEEAKRMSERVAPGGEGRSRTLGGGARTRNAPRARSATGSSAGVARSRKPGRPALPRPAATHPVGGDTKPAAITAPGPNCAGKLPAPVIGLRQLNEAVICVATGLNKTRELDERVWLLFADPEHDLEDPRALAEDLATQDSAAQQAGAALRLAAQQQRVRAILALPPDQRLHGRRFDLEAEAWLNTVASNRNRGFEPNSRHLISLPRMLDNAAGALVRVEALRAAVDILREAESPPDVTAAQVSQRYESLLSEITFLADLEVMAAARARADAAADAWIDAVCTTVLDWVDAVIEAGATESIDALNSTLESIPLNLIPPGEGESADEFPEELAADTGLGEIVDAVRAHALRASWRALLLEHRPRETVEKLDGDLRRRLRAHARITPRRERHQRNPRVALPVTSLDRLSGNPELAHLFVRLTLDGRLLFLEDYEDGSYIDVYERVESKRRQMHARARERASLTDTGELQTGSSYLHTLGRTSDPFARTEREVLAACVVDDEGERMLFDDS